MTNKEQIPIEHNMTQKDLNKKIKDIEKEIKILEKLRFINHRYQWLTDWSMLKTKCNKESKLHMVITME